jgi:hypothetical protein
VAKGYTIQPAESDTAQSYRGRNIGVAYDEREGLLVKLIPILIRQDGSSLGEADGADLSICWRPN